MNKEILAQRQAYPLDLKIELSRLRIQQWHKHYHGKVYVAFSGGRDSTVLLDLVRKDFPSVLAVFANTGAEFPEVRRFARSIENVEEIRPKMTFREVIRKYGYPVVSKEVSQKISEARTTKSAKLLHKRLHGDNNKYKSGKIPNKWQYLIHEPFRISHKCCDILKKNPFKVFERKSGLKPLLGTMAKDSHLRRQKFIRSGCNSFEGKEESAPLSFWTHEDILDYIKLNKLKYSSIYDMGYDSTGCTFCSFGTHLEKSDLFNKNKFQQMKKTHRNLYKYCIDTLKIGHVLDAIGVNY